MYNEQNALWQLVRNKKIMLPFTQMLPLDKKQPVCAIIGRWQAGGGYLRYRKNADIENIRVITSGNQWATLKS